MRVRTATITCTVGYQATVYTSVEVKPLFFNLPARGDRRRFFRLRLRSCSKIFECESGYS